VNQPHEDAGSKSGLKTETVGRSREDEVAPFARALTAGLEGRAGPAIGEAYSFAGERCDRSVARVLERIGAGDNQ
jgi:hypothetical protein